MDYLLKIYIKKLNPDYPDIDPENEYIPDYRYYATSKGIFMDSVEALALMNVPIGTSKKIDPAEASASVSSAKVEIINQQDMLVSQDIYKLIEEEGIVFYREKAELYAWDGVEFNMLFAGMIRSIRLDPYELKYTLEIADWFNEFKKPVFQMETSQYNNVSVEDINEHRMPTGFECYEVTENEEVLRRVRFDGTVTEFFKGFIQKIFSHDQIDVESGHLVDDWKDVVDEESIDEVIGLGKVTDLYFEFHDKVEDGFKFLKENLYRLLSCYPVISADTKIKYKIHRQPSVEEAQEIQNNSALFVNEINTLTVDSKEIEFTSIINHVLIKDRFNYIEDEYFRTTYYTNGNSFRKFRKLIPDKPHEIELEGLSQVSETETSEIMEEIRDRIFSRYSEHLIFVEATIPLIKLKFGCGDYILLDNSHIVAWEGDNMGKRGIQGGDPGEEDPKAKMNVEDEWQGYLDGNQFGWVYNHEVIKLEKEIKHELFNGEGGCLENHELINDWLEREGIE